MLWRLNQPCQPALLVEGSEKATQSTLIHDWDNHRDQNWSCRNVAQVVSFKANPAVDIFKKPFGIVKLPYHTAKFYCPSKCCKEFCHWTLSRAKRQKWYCFVYQLSSSIILFRRFWFQMTWELSEMHGNAHQHTSESVAIENFSPN